MPERNLSTEHGMSPAGVNLVADLLSDLAPGEQPPPIFYQIARLVPLPAVELIVFDENKQVLLTQREADDPYWPGQWHIPGTVIRATDASLGSAIKRSRQAELEGTEVTLPRLLRPDFRHMERGSELSLVHRAKLVGEPMAGQLFPIRNLPENIVAFHPPLVYEASFAEFGEQNTAG